jgi:vitamin B12 transporter
VRPAAFFAAASIGLAVFALHSDAQAQYSATAEVERPIAAEIPEEPTVTANVVDAQDRTKALETVDELMLEVPGTRLQRFGAFGSFTALSLRGAEFDHTTVLFGNIPLRSADGGAIDLSTIPINVLDRVEVYRGAAPAWLASSGIGGVLQLVPRQAHNTAAEAGLGIGSFGLVDSHAATTVVMPNGLRWTAVAGLAKSDNDFTYSDDGGTHFDSSDDVTKKRRNADLMQGHTLLHLAAPLWKGELEALAFGFGRSGGEAGPAFQGSELTQRTLNRYLTALRYHRQAPDAAPAGERWRWQLLSSAAYSRNQFTDRLGEIGLGQRATDDRSLLTQLRGAAEWDVLPWLGFTTVAQWEHETYAPQDEFAPQPVGTSDRDRLSGTLESVVQGRLGPHRWQLRPSARLELVSSRLSSIRPESLGTATEDLMVAPTFRVGSVLELHKGLALVASISQSTRVPTVVELFGDRGYLLGNTNLDSEKALGVDAGVNLQGSAGPLSTRSQLRGFVTSIQDLIVFAQLNAQQLYGPRNIGQAFLYGVEAGSELTLFEHWWLIANATAMLAEDDVSGRALPLRPRLQAYVRPEFRFMAIEGIDTGTVFVDLQYRSNFFTDVTNVVLLPEQWVFGLGTRWLMLNKQLEVAASVRNVFDATVRDVVAFPLPGRSVNLDMTWHMAFR